MRNKLFLFIILFCYIYPIYIKFFPIPTDRIIQGMGLFVFVFNIPFKKMVLKIKSLLSFFLLSLLFLILILLVQNWNYSKIDLYFFKDHLDIFMYFFSSYLIVYLLYKIDRHKMITNLFDCIVLVSVFQAIISFIFFFIPSTFEVYSSILSENASQGLLTRLGQIEKRLIGAGSAFFTGVVKYGVAFFALIILPYLNKSKVASNKLLYIVSFILITLAGIMTGRTFFLAIGLGLVLYILIDKTNAFRLIFKVIPITLAASLMVISLGGSLVNKERFDRIYNFVFEIFINYMQGEGLTTNSTEGTLSMYRFPTNIKTWLIGDGRMMMDSGSYYMGSDVGYVRMIFYFGIVLTILYILYQTYLFSILAKKAGSKSMRSLVLILLLWFLLLNFKGFVNLNNYLVLLFLAFGTQINFNKKYLPYGNK